jgi:YspA, cpYpsA-related SLOG family
MAGKMMRVLVCGGRDFSDGPKLVSTLHSLFLMPNDVIIHGNAPGADWMANAWAREHDIAVRVFPADWKKYGRAAGPIRNQQMLDEGKPHLVIAFPGGKGTADMVARAKRAGIEVLECPAR